MLLSDELSADLNQADVQAQQLLDTKYFANDKGDRDYRRDENIESAALGGYVEYCQGASRGDYLEGGNHQENCQAVTSQ